MSFLKVFNLKSFTPIDLENLLDEKKNLIYYQK